MKSPFGTGWRLTCSMRCDSPSGCAWLYILAHVAKCLAWKISPRTIGGYYGGAHLWN